MINNINLDFKCNKSYIFDNVSICYEQFLLLVEESKYVKLFSDISKYSRDEDSSYYCIDLWLTTKNKFVTRENILQFKEELLLTLKKYLPEPKLSIRYWES